METNGLSSGTAGTVPDSPRINTPTYVSALALHNKISNIADIPEASEVSENTYTMVFGSPLQRTQAGQSGQSMDHLTLVSEGADSTDEAGDLSVSRGTMIVPSFNPKM